jgi:NADH-quinone oxidoreductase subunit J
MATAGLYLWMGYQFLAAVQLAVYAGGIMVLYVFSIFLTSEAGDEIRPGTVVRRWLAGLTALAGFGVCGHIIYRNVKGLISGELFHEPTMQEIGRNMMGTDKYQYLLPFEAISILLLAGIIGAILIARKR